MANKFLVRSTEITSKIHASSTHRRPFWFGLIFELCEIVILSNVSEADKFDLHNSLKLSFTIILVLCANFAGCESFLESNSPDIVASSGASLEDPIDSSKFSVRGYLPLIQKDSVTHMHGLAVYVKKKLPFGALILLYHTSSQFEHLRLIEKGMEVFKIGELLWKWRDRFIDRMILNRVMGGVTHYVRAWQI